MTDQKWNNNNNNSKINELATSLIITNQITFVYAATRRDRLVQHLHTAHPGRSYKKIINNSRWLSCGALTHTHTGAHTSKHAQTHARTQRERNRRQKTVFLIPGTTTAAGQRSIVFTDKK